MINRRWLVIGCLVVMCSTSGMIHAQPVTVSQRARLTSQAQTRVVVTPDTLLARQTRALPHAREDVSSGVLRAQYRITQAPTNAQQPEVAALTYLTQESAVFGVQAPTDDLDIVDVKRGPYSSHVLFQQVYQGVPVHRRYVKVNLSRTGEPTMVISGYAPEVYEFGVLDVEPSVPVRAAQAVVANGVWEVPVEISGGERVVVVEADGLRLAWRFVVWPEGLGREWEVLVEAHTGALIQLEDVGTHAALEKGNTSVGSFSPKGAHTFVPMIQSNRRVDGSGWVFDPDPLTTAGAVYGDMYFDNNDRDTPELNAELQEVVLLDISEGGDGFYRLQGPFVNITSSIPGAVAYTPPAEADPTAFRYTRANDFFESVVAYYHIDKSQRYIQSLDIGHDTQNGPIPVNPHGRGSVDNSVYNPGSNSILFGTGGVDDGEDAFVIWHEYGHGLLEGSSPGLRTTTEGRALHEGWSDYWAASYIRGLVESREVASTDWVNGFRWDSGDGSIWPGRSFDYVGAYPEATNCDDVPASRCDIWDDGRLWATTMMELYSQLGKTTTDRLNLASHRYLSPPVTFRDAAEAILQADADLYGGTYIGPLLRTMSDRGLLDPNAFGPVIVHHPLPDTEQRGGSVSVEAEAVSSTVTGVTLVYGVDGTPNERVELTANQTTFSGALPLPVGSATVSYYLETRDGNGNQLFFPPTAPAEPYQFDVVSNVLVEQRSIFANVTPSGAWVETNNTWVLEADTTLTPQSSLVLEPFDVPVNVRTGTFTMRHGHSLGDSLGGNVKVSLDGGRTWTVLVPEQGYPGTYVQTGEQPLAGEAIFSGPSAGSIESRFDVSGYGGEQVRLRIDFATERVLAVGEFWRVERAVVSLSTEAEAFEVRRSFALHGVFPNPFSDGATVSYTLDGAMEVLLDVHDVLGRRVAVLAEGSQEAGTYTLRYDGSGLASGVYVVRLVAGDRQKTQTIIRAR